MKRTTTTKKKHFLLLGCLWLIVTLSVIETTYAKYVTNVNANANISIAYWNISVNTQDISQNSNLTNVISAIFPGNDYSLPGVIVPNSTGYFDLNIDSSKVSVSFSTTITTSINEASNLKNDLIISGYSLDSGENITNFEETETSFSVIIPQNVDTTSIRIYVTWIDDGIDSKEDTSLGISDNSAILDVNLSFSQIV